MPTEETTDRSAQSGVRFWHALTGRIRDRLLEERGGPGREILLRMARNIAHLVCGNGSSVVIGMVTLGLTARYLGPAALGILAVIEAYGMLCDQILRLETWQAVVKFGAAALEAGDERRFAVLVKLATVIDLLSAVLTGSIAFLAIPLAGVLMGWDDQTASMARVYTIALFFAINSAPVGILRLFNRFAQFAWLDPVIAVGRLAGTVLIIVAGGTLWAFLAMSVTLLVLQRLTLLAMAWRILRKNGFARFWREPLRNSTSHFPGFWTFTFSANAAVLLRKATQQLDILAVGMLVGSYQAGIYQIVRKLTLAVNTAGGMLQQVAFPDLARLWSRGDHRQFYRLVRNVEALTLAFGAVAMVTLVAIGRHFIEMLAGPAFQQAYGPLLVQSVASMLFLAGSTLRPALMCMGCQLELLKIMTLATLLFCAFLFASVGTLGLFGAALAHIVFAATVFVAATTLFRRRRLAEPPPLQS